MSESIGTTMRERPGNGALRATASSIMQDLDDLRRDVGRLASAASEAAGAQFRVTGERLNRLSRDMGSRANRSATYVGEQIRTHPGVAIGVSFGAGLLLGMLLARNNHLLRGGGTRTQRL